MTLVSARAALKRNRGRTKKAYGSMIEVENVSKYFGATRAVDRACFKVDKGESVGLLGPNGSGKTTIIRLLTGFFPPTSGRVLIGGLDVAEHSIETRRRLGYAPENMVL